MLFYIKKTAPYIILNVLIVFIIYKLVDIDGGFFPYSRFLQEYFLPYGLLVLPTFVNWGLYANQSADRAILLFLFTVFGLWAGLFVSMIIEGIFFPAEGEDLGEGLIYAYVSVKYSTGLFISLVVSIWRNSRKRHDVD